MRKRRMLSKQKEKAKKNNTMATTILLVLSVAILSLSPISCNFAPSHGELPFTQSAAYADNANGQRYMDINASNFFNPDGADNSNGTSIGTQAATSSPLWNGITNIIKTLITGIILPIGIIVSTWRTMYLAIFCFIAGADPLRVLDSPRYKKTSKGGKDTLKHLGKVNALGQVLDNPFDETTQVRAATFNTMTSGRNSGRMQYAVSWNNDVKAAMLIELKHLFIGLFITFSIWVILQIVIWISVIILQVIGGFGS